MKRDLYNFYIQFKLFNIYIWYLYFLHKLNNMNEIIDEDRRDFPQIKNFNDSQIKTFREISWKTSLQSTFIRGTSKGNEIIKMINDDWNW